ncbi:psbP domain-containing protein 6, chloroplastic [Amborella trichopoda]|nr:psbP domain-containing protein 6, chloroplastic [Amborella trichopoda]|eukprot:XP_006836240.2 psbP domain-containing protein 6, chloroplastic [Amborella trichopoda]
MRTGELGHLNYPLLFAHQAFISLMATCSATPISSSYFTPISTTDLIIHRKTHNPCPIEANSKKNCENFRPLGLKPSSIAASSRNIRDQISGSSETLNSSSIAPKSREIWYTSMHEQWSRRNLFKGLALLWILAKRPVDCEAREVQVGSYLPPLDSDSSFVVFKATTKDTPALRAGNVEPYQFILPPSWKQTRIANILSGNYCQPKCAEPWVEVKFEDEKQGKVQVVAAPLIRLTNKLNASIEEIGSPEKVIASLGPFVTGNSYDPDELIESNMKNIDGQTYYTYKLETPYALTGSHNLAKATAKGNTVVLFVASANDKQWPTSQKTLEAMLDSFRI